MCFSQEITHKLTFQTSAFKVQNSIFDLRHFGNFRATCFLNPEFSKICNVLCKIQIKFLFIEDLHQEKTDLFPSQAADACQTSEALPALREAPMKNAISELD